MAAAAARAADFLPGTQQLVRHENHAEWNVPREGVGYVTRFDVRREYLGRYAVQQAGGRDVLEYWIPAECLEEFNAHITGAITEEARYLCPVSDLEFTRAAHALGQSLPAAWRDYLTGSSWFSRGWLPTGCYPFAVHPGRISRRRRRMVPSRSEVPRPGDPGQRRQP